MAEILKCADASGPRGARLPGAVERPSEQDTDLAAVDGLAQRGVEPDRFARRSQRRLPVAERLLAQRLRPEDVGGEAAILLWIESRPQSIETCRSLGGAVSIVRGRGRVVVGVKRHRVAAGGEEIDGALEKRLRLGHFPLRELDAAD